MKPPPDPGLVAMILTLYEDRQFWRAEANRDAATARCAIAEHLVRDALLEDMGRRGGPRTAREYSERDWLREQLNPEVVEANTAARAQHRWDSPAKPTPKRSRKRALDDIYAAAVAGESGCV